MNYSRIVGGFDLLEGYLTLLEEAATNETVVALAILVFGVIFAKVIGVALSKINDKLKLVTVASLKSLAQVLELMIFLIFAIIALGVLGVQFARDVLVKVLDVVPNLLIIVLLLLLGYVIVNLVIDILKSFFIRIGKQDYLTEFGVSQQMINNVFFVLKIFLYIVLLSVTLNYYARPVPFVDSIITGVVFTFVFFTGALIAYSFRDYVANMFLARHIEKQVLKPGQKILLDGLEGEVLSVNNHGVVIESSTGYNVIIPNSTLMTKEIQVKRVRSNIGKIEKLMNNFTPQLPSHCGPASAVMMLQFFGYNVSQEELAKEAKTKVPGGTEPNDLINAVKKFTNNELRGKLVRFDEIFDLAEEVKAWIAEGALIILWYKKPVLFPNNDSKSGHYVLGVGVEGEELIIMDPSNETAGVYMVNNRVLEDAMDQYDISRGYIIFAKKGTSAFWRLNEGLIYSNVASYKNLSKSFERYLKRQFRQRNLINEIISEHLLSSVKEEKVKHVWKPDLTASKNKQEKDKSDAVKKSESKEEGSKK